MKLKLKQLDPNNLKQWIEKEIYIDKIYYSNLIHGKEQLKKDFDQVWFIDGPEGSGKTNLGVTSAYITSPPERRHNLIDRIIPNIEKADAILLAAQPGDSIVIDEAYGGMSSAGFAGKINKLLQRRFTEIRAKNLFVYIIAPTFMDINRYFAIWRSKCLVHTYLKGGDRSYAMFFSGKRKKKLYIEGRKLYYDYNVVKSNFKFRFLNEMPKLVDKKEYEERKRKANLEKKEEEVEDMDPAIVKKIWQRYTDNLDNCDPPLSQKQKAQIIERTTQTLRRLELAKENKNKEETTINA